jgi:hypothetical protein
LSLKSTGSNPIFFEQPDCHSKLSSSDQWKSPRTSTPPSIAARNSCKCSSVRNDFQRRDVEAWKKEAPPSTNETWTFPPSSTTMTVFLPNEPVQGIVSDPNFMTKKPETATLIHEPPASESELQRFERILLREQFKPLKAVLDHLGMAIPAMQAAIVTTNSYLMFLAKLGYRVIMVKQIHEQDCYSRLGPDGGIRAVVPQIHEQDCYSRLGPAGGIRAVLPVHDMATYSTLVTLVNFDSTLTTTPKSVDYYDDQLAEFKTQLMNKSGDAG